MAAVSNLLIVAIGAALGVAATFVARYWCAALDPEHTHRWWPLLATPLTIVVALALQALNLPLPLTIARLMAGAVLVAILCIDGATRLIPHVLIALAILLAVAAALLPGGAGFGSALIGGALGGGVFAVLVLLGYAVGHPGALGGGDAELALVIGLLTGFPAVANALALGGLLGGVGAFALLIVKRGRIRNTFIPYAPYMVLGALFILTRPGVIQ